MLKAAKFRAAAVPYAFLVEPDGREIILARNDVALPGDVRDPDRVNDVVRLQDQPDRLADRQMEFVGSGKDLARLVIEIANFPPPLMAGQHNLPAWILVERDQLTVDRVGRADERGEDEDRQTDRPRDPAGEQRI